METVRQRQGTVQLKEEISIQYFPTATPQERVSLSALANNVLRRYFLTAVGKKLLSIYRVYRENRVLEIDYHQLEKLRIRGLDKALRSSPHDVFLTLAAAAHQCYEATGATLAAGSVTVRLYNDTASLVSVENIKEACLGKVVTVRGRVVQLRPTRPSLQSATCICHRCGWSTERVFDNEKGAMNAMCQAPRCKCREFDVEMSSAKIIDWQQIEVQEDISVDKQLLGAVGRRIKILLLSDLTDSCCIGDSVAVMGVVKTASIRLSSDKGHLPLELYVEALSLNQLKESLPRQIKSQQFGDIRERDRCFIRAFHEAYKGDQLRHLVHAFCPQIYGHEVVKAGLLLALVCGNDNGKKNGTGSRLNSKINVLLIEDPGMEATELLKACVRVAGSAVHIDGRRYSKESLTGSVTMDPATRGPILAAGPIPLSKNGVCCIHGFDQLQKQHPHLCEAMEQLEIWIEGAGMAANIEATSTIIAGVCPVDGHYQSSKTLIQNLRMEESTLSCFDLVFVMADQPNEQNDKILSEHILRMQSTKLHSKAKVLAERDLSQRLSMAASEKHSLIPVELLRKYIAYVRRCIQPKLSSEAKRVLEEFYIDARTKQLAPAGLPFTGRHLRSLIKLAEARAKIELRGTVTASDAEEVIALLQHSMRQRFMDDHRVPDLSATTANRGGRSKQTEAFLKALKRYANTRETDMVSMDDIYVVADEIELHCEDLQDLVERLNDAGALLKKGARLYKVLGCGASLLAEADHAISGRLTGRGFSTLCYPEE